jgi:hypothetical protein
MRLDIFSLALLGLAALATVGVDGRRRGSGRGRANSHEASKIFSSDDEVQSNDRKESNTDQ